MRAHACNIYTPAHTSVKPAPITCVVAVYISASLSVDEASLFCVYM